jgi:UDP-hydrolysing UDP-N-acetyl-D-glucosamine 2-epimerase
MKNTKIKNIIIVSSSRADRWLLEPVFDHLGDECEFRKFNANLSVTYDETIWQIGDADRNKKIILLGDRWETLLLAFGAIQNKCIIYHLHGGEETFGSADNIYRNAITKLSHVHLTANQKFSDRIIKMGESPSNVITVGSIGVWRAKRIPPQEKENLLTVILHPNTIETNKTEQEITILLNSLKQFTNDFRIEFYAPNYDSGREIIECKIKEFCGSNLNTSYIKATAGDEFLINLKRSKCIIGNSSCGVIESSSLMTPTINIGNRQDGRPRASSVMQCGFNVAEIKSHIESAINDNWLDSLFNNPYDNVEHDTVDMICNIIRNHPVEFGKRFFD